jgi:hypothetical protein
LTPGKGESVKNVAFLIATIAAVLSLDGSTLAGGGCCKTRASYTAAWSRSGDTFEQCQAQNGARDDDNVYDERGLVWWDVRCN